VSRPVDFFNDLTDDRLSLLAGIYATVWRSVVTKRSPLTMPVAEGIARYCDCYQAFIFAGRAHAWLDVARKAMYYHLALGTGSTVLRVDRLDGTLFALEPLRKPKGHDVANLWLAGVPNERLPYLRLEIETPGEEACAMLRLLSDGLEFNDGATEHDRWAVDVANVELDEIHAWAGLPPARPEVVITPAMFQPPELDAADPPAAEFELRSAVDEVSDENFEGRKK